MANKKKLFCVHGHLRSSENISKHGACIECCRERAGNWAKKNPERAKAKRLEWRSKNKERVAAYILARKPIDAERGRMENYGVDKEMFEKMLIEHKFSCAICGRHQGEFKKSLSIDHDHETGAVRGLLCTPCNFYIGWIENKKWFKKAQEYLERFKKDSNGLIGGL